MFFPETQNAASVQSTVIEANIKASELNNHRRSKRTKHSPSPNSKQKTATFYDVEHSREDTGPG
jgi:hypothetical protein